MGDKLYWLAMINFITADLWLQLSELAAIIYDMLDKC